MTRAALAIGAVALATGSAAVGQLSRYGGGGRSVSPDGRLAVVSPPRSQAAIDRAPAMAWLHGPGGIERRLLAFERGLAVVWPTDGRHVLLLGSTIHFYRVSVFALGSRDAVPPDRIERAIERSLRARGPRLGTIENRLIAIGTDRRALCLLAEESGLPPGRREGSFIARRGYFQLDLDRGVAIPTTACAGAVIDQTDRVMERLA